MFPEQYPYSKGGSLHSMARKVSVAFVVVVVAFVGRLTNGLILMILSFPPPLHLQPDLGLLMHSGQVIRLGDVVVVVPVVVNAEDCPSVVKVVEGSVVAAVEFAAADVDAVVFSAAAVTVVVVSADAEIAVVAVVVAVAVVSVEEEAAVVTVAAVVDVPSSVVVAAVD